MNGESFLNREILRELASISRSIAVIRERSFSEYGLTKGQHAFLLRVIENPKINQKKISELMKVDKGTTAKAIKKLIDSGYVYKERSKANYKEYQVFPTEKALELYPILIKEIKKSGSIALEGVSVELIYNELQKVNENLNKELEKK